MVERAVEKVLVFLDGIEKKYFLEAEIAPFSCVRALKVWHQVYLGSVSSENRTQPFFRKISFSSVRSSSFLRPVLIPGGFNVSDVKFVLTTLVCSSVPTHSEKILST